MEHLKFFELPTDPFQNECDERFYYESAPQKRARLRLMRGIVQRRALSVLTGGPGLGKTTLAHSLLRALDPREFAAHYLSIPHEACASGWLLPNVARAFGVHAPASAVQALVDQLHAQLASIAASRRSSVLLIDEAQLFRNRDAMEEFRGLLNLLQDGRKLVTLVLFGLPELGEILKLDAPLAQRVEIRAEITPMDWLESQAYVSHRLRLAGSTRPVFSPDALAALFRCSGGVPRLLNTIADNALFEAFLSETRPVDAEIVVAAAEALGLTPLALEDSSPSLPGLAGLSDASPDSGHAPADWLEPLAPMPADSRLAKTQLIERAPEPRPKPEPEPAFEALPELEPAEEISASFEAAELVEDSSSSELELSLESEAEPKAEFGAEPEAASEAIMDLEIEPPRHELREPELPPEDSDWSLGAALREPETPTAPPVRERNEDSFDLRSLALEVEAEPEPASDDEELDLLFEEIQRDD